MQQAKMSCVANATPGGIVRSPKGLAPTRRHRTDAGPSLGPAARACVVFAFWLLAAPCWSVDGVAAEKLVKDNNCSKCHTVDRKKDGPAYRDVAAKFRDQSDAQAKLIYHVTSGEKVKFPDGHEERHKKVKDANPEEVKNLADWILSLQGGSKY